MLQSVKFSPNGDYVCKRVPELPELDSKDTYAPRENGIYSTGFPEEPIVEGDKELCRRTQRRSREGLRA